MSLFKPFSVIVKDDERAMLTRDGRFERLLGPGRFSAFDFGGHLKAEVIKVVRAELPAERALLLGADLDKYNDWGLSPVAQ